MCGIVGMAGNFNKQLLEDVLKSIDHRGEDYSNTFIDEEKGIGLGHNLLSIFNLIDENNEICDNLEYNKQPIILNNLLLEMFRPMHKDHHSLPAFLLLHYR